MVCFMLVGCGETSEPAPKLEGRWVRDQTLTVLHFMPNGRFLLALYQEPAVETYGRYVVRDNGNHVMFVNDPDSEDCPGIEGTYSYEIQNDRLTLTKVVDVCQSREEEFSQPFTRIYDPTPNLKPTPLRSQ